MHRIGQRLVEVRRASGLGVRGFAAAITQATGYEISHTSVANYESGTTVPAAYAVSVSRTFSVGLPWLLTGEGLPNQVGRPELENAFRRIAAIVSDALPGVRGMDAEQDAFFRLSPDLFVILSSTGEIVRANPAWDALLGRPIRELEHTQFASLVHESDRAKVDALLRSDHSGGSEALRVTTSSGDPVAITLRVSHVGGLIYGVGRWSPPESVAARSRWRFIVTNVLERATDLYILFDDESRCLAANRAAAEALGALPGTMIGVHGIDELVVPRCRDDARAALGALLKQGMLERDIVLEVAGSPVPMTGRAVANVEPGVHLGVAYPRRREESTRTQSGQEVTTA